MANAKRCDRCGLYYDEYNVGNNSEKINILTISDEFMKWLRKENEK